MCSHSELLKKIGNTMIYFWSAKEIANTDES